MTLHHLLAAAAVKQGVRVVMFDVGQGPAHIADTLADAVMVHPVHVGVSPPIGTSDKAHPDQSR